MIWTFLFSVLAAEVKQKLGDVYLFRNESFLADLHDFFQGEFLEFKIVLGGENENIIGNYNVSNILSYPWKSNDEQVKKISLFSEFGSSYVICSSGLDIYFFEIDLLSSKVKFKHNKTIHTTLINAEVTSARIRFGGVFLIITGIEKIQDQSFKKNLLFHSYLGIEFILIPSWDLNYIEGLSMNLQILPNMVFWGQVQGKTVVFLGIFKINELSIYQQIDHYYRYNSSLSFDLELTDVLLNVQNLLLLQKDLGVLHYDSNDFVFYQKRIIVLSSYGNSYRFSKNNWQTDSITDFGVVTDLGIVLIKFIDFNIVGCAKFNFESDIEVIVLDPYLFLMSSSLESLEIYKITQNDLFILYSIPMNWAEGPVTLVKSTVGYVIIKETNSTIDFFYLNFTEKYLNVAAEYNTSLVIQAKDAKSAVNSTLNIFVLEDLYRPYQIFNYRKTDIASLNQIVYLNKLIQKVEFKLSSVLTGWQVSFDVSRYEIQGFEIDTKLIPPVTFLDGKTLNKQYQNIIYNQNLYSIDEDGVYLNEKLVYNKKNPKNIILGIENVQVLYSNYIVFFSPQLEVLQKVLIDVDCDVVFKFIEIYTFCADLKKLLIIHDFQIVGKYELEDMIKHEKLIDIGYLYSLDTYANYLYVLSDESVTYIFHTDLRYTIQSKIKLKATFIIATMYYLYTIGNEIQVFDLYLKGLVKVIPLPDPPVFVWNSFDTLYIKTFNNFLVINGLAPIIQSLVFIQENYSCDLHQSGFNIIFTVCNNIANFFRDSCLFDCYTKCDIMYTVINSSAVDVGTTVSVVKTEVSSPTLSFVFNTTFDISTYSIYLFFDEKSIDRNTFSIDYDKSLTLPLSRNFLGFNLDFSLYINNTIVDKMFDWVSLNPRVLKNGELPPSHQNFIDHDAIRGTENVFFLTNSSIEIYKISFNYEINNSSTPPPVFVKSIPLSLILKPQSNCSSIDYISTYKDQSLFILVCSRLYNISEYYDGNQKNYSLAKSTLTFLQINIYDLTISNFTKIGTDHEVQWIHVVTSSPICFVIICLDSRIMQNIETITNNNAYIYNASWKGTVSIQLLNVVNFYSLSLSNFQVTCADGIYFSSEDCESSITLYAYLSDKLFGLRVVKITNDSVELLSNLEYSKAELLTSVGVCGNSLFVLSAYTYIDQYFIDKNFLPKFYITFQPSYDGGFVGVNSVISCSTYYKPRYLAIYLFSAANNSYQMRLVDLQVNLYSSYIKFIDIPASTNLNYKGQSLFITENLITVLGASQGMFSTYLISDLQMTFPVMNYSQYKKMKNQLGSNKFNLKIIYSNQYNKKSSSNYLVTRLGPDDNDDDGDGSSAKLWWLWVVFSIVALILSIVTFTLYKKYFGRKKNQQEISSKSLISTVELNRRGRMSLMASNEMIN